MITTAFINLWDHRIGAVAWDQEQNIGHFEYDPDFIEKGLNPAPLKMPVNGSKGRVFSFPETRNNGTFRGLPGLLADILPDKYGNVLINTWLASQGRPSDSLNPVEILCFIGTRGMGAIEIEPAYSLAANRSTVLEIDSLVETAQKILEGKEYFRTKVKIEDDKSLLDILKIGTSAGGARAKAIIAFNPITKEVRSGQAKAPKGFSHWILKFDGVIDKQFGASSGYGKVELAYYLMALDAGIEMMESRLLKENGRAHFLTKRFDRESGNEKIHVQSFCALRHFDFNNVGFYSYEQLFETMRMLNLPYPQAEQLYRRMVFNVMGRNCDDHTKNFDFMMDKDGIWKLSPAFDVCHAYRPGSSWVSQHSLSINGKRNNIEKSDLLEVAAQMNIRKPEKIINRIADVIGMWNDYAKRVDVEPELIKAIGKTLLIIK